MNTQILIIWSIVGIAALAVPAWICRCYRYRPQHAGSGEGALTVRYLVMRVEAETSSGGRHRLREPTKIRGAPTDRADEGTRMPALPPEVLAADPDGRARNPLVLQRIIAGLRRA